MVMLRDARAHLRSMLASLVFGAFFTLSLSGYAAEPSIWYRTGEGCPDGVSFLARLENRGIRGHLAAVGDRVDFVVTLGTNGERSSGRLERQTSQGTIAIREVEDVRCEAVADALALTLALTFDPASHDPPETAVAAEQPAAQSQAGPPPPSGATALPTAVAASEHSAAPSPPDHTSAPTEPGEQDSGEGQGAGAEQGRVRLGAALAAWDLFQGPLLLQAGPFAEVEAPASFVLPRASLRLVLQGGLRPDADASVQVWLAAARVEACPLALGRGSISVRPCAAFDAGVIGASAEAVADTALWSDVAAHARLMFELGRLGLEAQAGGIVPITHYEVKPAGSRDILEKTSGIGFAGGVGVSFRFE